MCEAESCNSTTNLQIHHPNPPPRKMAWTETEKKRYMEFEDIQVLCKRCHFAHHKGMDLCPVCKKKYKKKRYNTCYDCIPTEMKPPARPCFHCNKTPAKRREDGYYECDECYAGYKAFEKMMDAIEKSVDEVGAQEVIADGKT